MRFTIVVSILAVGALARPNISPRDSTTIHDLLQTISASMANLDSQVLQYHGGPPNKLHEAGSALYEKLGAGIDLLKHIDPLTADDVTKISPVSGELSTIGAKLLKNLAEAAPVFAANRLCCPTHEFTVELGEVSNKFFEAAKEKFPAEAQGYATEEIGRTNSGFAQVQAAFAPENCVDSNEGAQEGSGDQADKNDKGNHGSQSDHGEQGGQEGHGEGQSGHGDQGNQEGHGGQGGQGDHGKQGGQEGHGEGQEGHGNQGGHGGEPSGSATATEEPSSTTSAIWYTGTSLPGEPTSSPNGDNNGNHGGQGGDNHPKPVAGSAASLSLTNTLLALGMLAAIAL